jgi:hypothetical protein
MVTTERVRVVMPPPHNSEQVAHSLQLESLQSIGQAKVLQDLALDNIGQATPPWAAVVKSERERFLVPVPQVAEHEVKADQAVTLQSMGHPKILQARVLERTGQATPPAARPVRMERLLLLEPVPQDLVQAEYEDQAVTLQSMGQAKVLQVLYSLV